MFVKSSRKSSTKLNKGGRCMLCKKIALGVLGTLLSSGAYSGTLKIGAVVLDDETALPMPNVEVCFSFKEDVGWRAWTESSKHHKTYCRTDSAGYCHTTGQSNCGQGGCYVKNPCLSGNLESSRVEQFVLSLTCLWPSTYVNDHQCISIMRGAFVLLSFLCLCSIGNPNGFNSLLFANLIHDTQEFAGSLICSSGSEWE